MKNYKKKKKTLTEPNYLQLLSIRIIAPMFDFKYAVIMRLNLKVKYGSVFLCPGSHRLLCKYIWRGCVCICGSNCRLGFPSTDCIYLMVVWNSKYGEKIILSKKINKSRQCKLLIATLSSLWFYLSKPCSRWKMECWS